MILKVAKSSLVPVREQELPPGNEARAIQVSVLTGCCVNRSRVVLMMDVTG
jgi:hypothetical protein